MKAPRYQVGEISATYTCANIQYTPNNVVLKNCRTSYMLTIHICISSYIYDELTLKHAADHPAAMPTTNRPV